MLQRLIVILLVAGAAYWYWSGPYQDSANPDYATQLDNNAKALSDCIRNAAYRAGRTATGTGAEGAEAACAEELGLYNEDGRWHSYSATRPD